MENQQITKIISGAIAAIQQNENLWQLEGDALFLNGTKITVFLEHKDNNWFLNDAKETLKYMNELYELKSDDVKKCISAVVKIYGFSITGGMLLCKVPSLQQLSEKYFDFIMCIGQLTNMFAFFDKPNN